VVKTMVRQTVRWKGISSICYVREGAQSLYSSINAVNWPLGSWLSSPNSMPKRNRLKQSEFSHAHMQAVERSLSHSWGFACCRPHSHSRSRSHSRLLQGCSQFPLSPTPQSGHATRPRAHCRCHRHRLQPPPDVIPRRGLVTGSSDFGASLGS
jgi:hypothetical protein